MSWIFEALQQAELDRAGVIAPEHRAAAAEVLRAVENEIEQGPSALDLLSQNSPLHSTVPIEGRLVALNQLWSLSAEKFRFLALRLRQLQQRRRLKKVLITSTVPEEGKSFVSANLAISMAKKREQKVLLVEGDLRRPTLSASLGIETGIGLSECLRGGQRFSAGIRYIENLGLWFLPAGSPVENPVEAMQSGQLAENLRLLCAAFEWIVIDSPPLLPLADTSVWSRAVDGTLLVTRPEKTRKRELKRGIEMLDKSSILGVVVNDCDGADQNSYYARYGYHLKKQEGEPPKSLKPLTVIPPPENTAA
jgi:protein-tyrosine kinase